MAAARGDRLVCFGCIARQCDECAQLQRAAEGWLWGLATLLRIAKEGGE